MRSTPGAPQRRQPRSRPLEVAALWVLGIVLVRLFPIAVLVGVVAALDWLL